MKVWKKNNILKQYQDISPAAKVSIWYIICNIIQNGISFITLPIFTRLLSVEQYGTVTVYNSWQGIISILATLGLSRGVFMTAYIKYEDDKDRLLSSFQGLSFILTLIIFTIYTVFREFFSGIIQLPYILMVCMFVEILVQPGYAFWLTKLKYENKYIPMVISSLLVSIANPILGIIMVLHAEEKDVARIFSATIVYVIVYGVITLYNQKRGKCFWNKQYWKYALEFGIPLVPHYLSLIVLGQADRLMIDNMCGKREAAIYGMGYNVAMVISIVYSGINQALGPSIMRSLKNKKYDGIRETINSILIIMFGCMFLVSLIYPELMRVIATDEYYEVVSIMPIITFSIAFTTINNCFAKVELFYEKKYFIMFSSMVTAVLNVVLNYVFIQMFGYKAASFTTMLSYVVLSLLHYMVYRRICVNELGGEHIFDIKIMTVIGVGTILVAVIVCATEQFVILRYALVFLIVILTWKKRELIKRLVKYRDR